MTTVVHCTPRRATSGLAGGRLELVLAHPFGITEVEEGSLTVVGGSLVLDLVATVIGRTTTAKEVTEIERSFHLDGDELTYEVRMAAVGQPLQHHLAARCFSAGGRDAGHPPGSPEAAGVEVLDGLDELGPGVHHERAVGGDRLADRPAAEQQHLERRRSPWRRG